MKFAFILFSLLGSSAFAQTWTWKGFEVFGNKKTASAVIIKNFPIQVGTPYVEDSESWKKACAQIKTKHDFIHALCSSLRFANGEAFMVIDVVEKGDENRIKFRAAPTQVVPPLPLEVLNIYHRLNQRIQLLFEQGAPSPEFGREGYLDYDDAEAHALVMQLTKLTPPLRGRLFEVLEKDKDPGNRADAANLLNWTVDQLESSIQKANQLLTQLDWPSHGDRNKAIINLLILAQNFPADLSYLKQKGERRIAYVAEHSVLSNVGEIAKQLLKLLPKAD